MKETWKNAAALMMSYLILLFLPQNINIFAYVILGLSAFLFMVGYFRLTEIFTAVYKKIGYLKARCLEMAVGLGIVTVGGILLYRTHGSGKAMVISFLFAMESIAILGTTGNDELHLKLERILSVIVCLYAVGMVIFAVLVLIWEKLDGVETATLCCLNV